MAGSWQRRFTPWFYRNFFYLLFVSICVSQWVTLCWLVRQRGVAPLWLHGAGLAAVYLFNRLVARGTMRMTRGPRPRNPLTRVYYFLAFTSLVCALYLGVIAIGWAISAAAIGLLWGADSLTTTNRVFGLLGDGGVAAIFVATFYGYTIGQMRLKLRRFAIPLHRLPTALDGIRITQISDIHIGDNLDRSQLERFVAQVNGSAPDLICITGDIVDAPSADLDGYLPILARLRARHGVFAILGNHDHYAGANRVIEGLKRHTDFRLLRDDSCSVDINGETLHIIGLDDRGRDWARGLLECPILQDLHGRRGADGPVLLLSHRPDIFNHAAALGIELTLSGHTHGGQLGLPWFNGRVLNPAWVMTPFDRGMFERNGSYLYVNCGLGVVGQRLRFFTPREISIFELRSVPQAAS